MKAKLIKENGKYYLDGDNLPNPRRLNLDNCDEIFSSSVVDVDNLVDKFVENLNVSEKVKKDVQFGYQEGFLKAMELNKDKLFTVEDLTHVIDIAVQWALRTNGTGETYQEMSRRIYQSLQPTEIEVEIEMTEDWYDGFKLTPKLDENGCLILKKI